MDSIDELVAAPNSPFTNRLEACIYEFMLQTSSNHGWGDQTAYANFAIGCAAFIKERVAVAENRKPRLPPEPSMEDKLREMVAGMTPEQVAALTNEVDNVFGKRK